MATASSRQVKINSPLPEKQTVAAMSQIKRHLPLLELEAVLSPPPPAASIFSRHANLTAPGAFTARDLVGIDLGSPISLDYFDRQPYASKKISAVSVQLK
jgi:hypothetical protein